MAMMNQSPPQPANASEWGNGGEDQNAAAPQVSAEEIESLKRLLFMRLLDDGARRRLNNIRTVSPEFAAQLETVLLRIIQAQGPKRINEETLISVIRQLRPAKKETIIRKD